MVSVVCFTTIIILLYLAVDDLRQIDQEHINEGILASCCLLVFLNDETMLVNTEVVS